MRHCFHSKRAFQREKFPVPTVVILRVVVAGNFEGIGVGEPCPVVGHPDFLRVGAVAGPRTSKASLLAVVAEGPEWEACSIDPSARPMAWGRMW